MPSASNFLSHSALRDTDFEVIVPIRHRFVRIQSPPGHGIAVALEQCREDDFSNEQREIFSGAPFGEAIDGVRDFILNRSGSKMMSLSAEWLEIFCGAIGHRLERIWRPTDI